MNEIMGMVKEYFSQEEHMRESTITIDEFYNAIKKKDMEKFQPKEKIKSTRVKKGY